MSRPDTASRSPTHRFGLCRPRLAVDGLSGIQQTRDSPDHAQHGEQPTSKEHTREEKPYRRGEEEDVELNSRHGQLQNQVGKLAPPGACILFPDRGALVGEQAFPSRQGEIGQQLHQVKGIAAQALRQGLLLRPGDGAARAVDQRRDVGYRRRRCWGCEVLDARRFSRRMQRGQPGHGDVVLSWCRLPFPWITEQ